MTWLNEPEIETHEQEGVPVVRITGDLLHCMPDAWRRKVLELLFVLRGSERIVIDLKDIGRMSSWGEQRIKSLARTVRKAAVAADPARSAMYAGLSVELGTLNPPVRLHAALDGALEDARRA